MPEKDYLPALRGLGFVLAGIHGFSAFANAMAEAPVANIYRPFGAYFHPARPSANAKMAYSPPTKSPSNRRPKKNACPETIPLPSRLHATLR